MYISKKVLIVIGLALCLFAFFSNNNGFDLGILTEEYPFLSQIDDEVEATIWQMKQRYQRELRAGIEFYDRLYYRSAIAHLSRANRIFPTASGSLMLGGACFKMKRFEDAETYLKGAILIARKNGFGKIQKSAEEILKDIRSLDKDAI
jgi:tetratricopeptide (TPR) repeat protein